VAGRRDQKQGASTEPGVISPDRKRSDPASSCSTRVRKGSDDDEGAEGESSRSTGGEEVRSSMRMLNLCLKP
jgi:hypothetical protein